MDAVILKDSITNRMTDDEFLRFCLENPDLRIERDRNLNIIIMPPVTTLSAYSSGAAFTELSIWNKRFKKGYTFDSSTGFSLPDRSVLSPDAAWVSREKWSSLSEDDKDKFVPVCPEFVIEVKSKSDSLDDLMKKMVAWMKNGCHLAWLIDLRNEVIFIYRPGQKEEKIDGLNRVINGEGPVEGFDLDLSLLKI